MEQRHKRQRQGRSKRTGFVAWELDNQRKGRKGGRKRCERERVCVCVRVGMCVCGRARDITKTGKRSVRKEMERRERRRGVKGKGWRKNINVKLLTEEAGLHSHSLILLSVSHQKGFLQSLFDFQGFPLPFSVSRPADRNSITYLT